MTGFTYKSYSFTDKDPIIDQVRTVYQDSGMSYKDIAEHSGVTPTTLSNWFGGTTKKPQAATINAVLRALGYKLSIQAISVAETIKPTVQPISTRHVVQMAKYRKRKA